MRSRYEVWLNDVALSSLDPDIYVADIAYQAAPRTYEKSKLAGRDGAYSGRGYMESNGVIVSFAVRKYSTQERMRAVQAVCAWCSGGGWLKASDRILQRMYVRCTELPTVTSAMRWTENLSVEFTAFDYPYWQDTVAQTHVLDAGDEETMSVVTALPAAVEATVTAAAAVTEIEIDVGDTGFVFTGLEMTAGDTLEISYTDEHHILQVRSGNTSLLDKRTAQSSDDLIAVHGANAVSFTADGNATCTLRVKGVYV